MPFKIFGNRPPPLGQLAGCLQGEDITRRVEEPDPEHDKRLRPFFMSGVPNHDAEQAIGNFHAPTHMDRQATIVSLVMEMTHSEDKYTKHRGYLYIARILESPEMRNPDVRQRVSALFFRQAQQRLNTVLEKRIGAIASLSRLNQFELLLLKCGPQDGSHLLHKTLSDAVKERKKDPSKIAKKVPRDHLQPTAKEMMHHLDTVLGYNKLPHGKIASKWSLGDLAKFARRQADLALQEAGRDDTPAAMLRSWRDRLGARQTPPSNKRQVRYEKYYRDFGRPENDRTARLLGRFGVGKSRHDKDPVKIETLLDLVNSGNKRLEACACHHLKSLLEGNESCQQAAVVHLYNAICKKIMTLDSGGKDQIDLATLSNFELCLLRAAMPTGTVLVADAPMSGLSLKSTLDSLFQTRTIEPREPSTIADLTALLDQRITTLEKEMAASVLYPQMVDPERPDSLAVCDCSIDLNRWLHPGKRLARSIDEHFRLAFQNYFDGEDEKKRKSARVWLNDRMIEFGDHNYEFDKAFIKAITRAIADPRKEYRQEGFLLLSQLLSGSHSKRAMTLLIEDTFERIDALRKKKTVCDQNGRRLWGFSEKDREREILGELPPFNAIILRSYCHDRVDCTTLDSVHNDNLPDKFRSKRPSTIDDIEDYCQLQAPEEEEAPQKEEDVPVNYANVQK